MSPFQFETWDSILYNVEKNVLGLLIGFILLFVLLLQLLNEKNTIRFSNLDLLLLIYCIFQLIHAIVFIPINLDPIFIIENTLLIILYVCFRNIKRSQLTTFYWVFILAGIHQIYFGLIKQTNWFAPGYNLTDLKGSFINQGPFAGFIACLIVIVFGLLLNSFRKKRIKYRFLTFIYLFLFTFFVLILFYTNSRAAWFGGLVGLVFFIWCFFGINFWITKLLKTYISKTIFYVSSLVLVFGFLYSLYNLKKDSANGRILIWKVVAEMISDAPLLGQGINSFPSNYMHYQGTYLGENLKEPLKNLAGNTNYAFNEILRLTAEQGLIGLSLIGVLVFFYIFKFRKQKNPLENDRFIIISKSGLIVIFTFGLFSYPMDILQLKIIFLFFLANLSTSEPKKTNFNKRLRKKFVLIGILFIILLGSYKTYKIGSIYKEWNMTLLQLRKGNTKDYIRFSSNNYILLNSNGYFLGYFAKSLFKKKQYSKALELYHKAFKVIPSTTLCIDIGKCYEKLENYEMAEVFWVKAKNMAPSQFKPEYLIAKMYFDNGDKEKAKEIAIDLLNNRHIKIYSIEVYEIIEALKNIIK